MPRTAPEPAPTRLSPINPREFGYDEARRLLWRAGFGGTPGQIRTLASWGRDRAVDALVDYEEVPEDATGPDGFRADIVRPLTEAERREYRQAQRDRDEDTLARFRLRRMHAQRADRDQIGGVQKWWLTRMIETPRPLQEKLTLFWHGHFATSYRTIENSFHMAKQNEFFRANAAGSLEDLLRGIIRDPAMLKYLDNDESRKDEPNENLARELMELFSLGVGAYSERDIREGARALTGYTFRGNEFYFDEQNHDAGAKRILGRQGALDGDGFVDAILRQQACAEFICAKLYGFFVRHIPTNPKEQDDRTRSVVRQLAQTMRTNRYAVRPVLRQLFRSSHFYHEASDQMIKSPAELVVGAVRTLNTPVRDLAILNDAMDLMGQRLLFPPSVKGWDGGRSWINTSTLFVRHNILAFLLTGKKPVGYDPQADREVYDPTALLEPLETGAPGASTDPDAVAAYVLTFMLGSATPEQRARVGAFIAKHGGVRPDVVTGAILLITTMPEYQLC